MPLGRFAWFAAAAAAPPAAVLVFLAAIELLGWTPALLAAAACAAALAAMVRWTLGSVYRGASFVELLARAGDAETPRGREPFPEFFQAVAALRDAWMRERARLSARADSAESILEELPYPLVLLNADRQILRTTVGVAELLGEAVPGRDLSSLLRDPEVLAAVDRVLAGGGRELVDFEAALPAERSLNAQVQSLSPAFDGTAAVLTFFDVTEIRQTHQMRSDFVANASHELKTPLSVLSGCIETLLGPARDDPEGRRKFTDMMANHAARMTQLIDDLLSLSRIEQNENSPPTDLVDLSRILSGVAGALELPASKRGIQIVIEPGLGAREIVGDTADLKQLFGNLVENAINYGGENEAVRIVTRFDEPDWAEVSVTDNGPGIAAEHIPRLTERFYRVDATRSRAVGGTGLGLAIVKHIVNRHRGEMKIDSVAGAGSTFTVRLPVSEAGPR